MNSSNYYRYNTDTYLWNITRPAACRSKDAMAQVLAMSSSTGGVILVSGSSSGTPGFVSLLTAGVTSVWDMIDWQAAVEKKKKIVV